VFWRYLIGVLEIYDWCPGDLIGVMEIFTGVLEIFGFCLGDISLV